MFSNSPDCQFKQVRARNESRLDDQITWCHAGPVCRRTSRHHDHTVTFSFFLACNAAHRACIVGVGGYFLFRGISSWRGGGGGGGGGGLELGVGIRSAPQNRVHFCQSSSYYFPFQCIVFVYKALHLGRFAAADSGYFRRAVIVWCCVIVFTIPRCFYAGKGTHAPVNGIEWYLLDARPGKLLGVRYLRVQLLFFIRQVVLRALQYFFGLLQRLQTGWFFWNSLGCRWGRAFGFWCRVAGGTFVEVFRVSWPWVMCFRAVCCTKLGHGGVLSSLDTVVVLHRRIRWILQAEIDVAQQIVCLEVCGRGF